MLPGCIYDRQIEAERVRKALIRRGLEKGREQGIAIGEARSEALGLIKTARRMKTLGLHADTIVAATGLSPKEVAEL
jgi:predicted transposase/invertase (TIGR01784 family)